MLNENLVTFNFFFFRECKWLSRKALKNDDAQVMILLYNLSGVISSSGQTVVDLSFNRLVKNKSPSL
jgi:hypothetical protein